MLIHHPGRHRVPGFLTPALSLYSVVSRSARPATKASAVIVLSGAMVASLALPAAAVALPSEIKAVAPTAVAVPSVAQAPLATPSFGNIGFAGIDKPKPRPKPKPKLAPVVPERSTTSASRSTSRAPVAQAPQSGGVLGIAASLAGIYYVYGGTTTAGFDCSGFTQYVFGKVGISLPRTAEAQRQFVTTVSNPMPGDLVFFGVPAGHMGIYAGNGMMWDSPRTGKAISLRSIYSSNVTYGRP